MLACLLGLLLAAGPLLRGSWDLWAQTLLFLVLTGGSAAWLCGRLAVGYLPLPSRRALIWGTLLVVMGALSTQLSPLKAYAVVSWRVWLAAIWIFMVLAVLSKDQRAAIDEAVRVAAWSLMLLALYQHFHQKIMAPASSLLNQNVFANAILLFLPLAVQKRDYLLAGGLLICLVWSRSAGAWLGLSAALLLSRRGSGGFSSWLGWAIGLCCAVVIYSKFQSPEVLHRWQWWSAALEMIWARPWLGHGPGAFAHILGAYRPSGSHLSLYAHQHILETAAECGAAFALVWLAGIGHCLRLGGPHKRFGAFAALVQSLWDYALSIPANLWLFSYFVASAMPESSRGINIPSRYKLPAALLVCGLGASFCSLLLGQWQAEKFRVQARELLFSGGSGEAIETARSLLFKSAALADDPEVFELLAAAELRRRGPAQALQNRFLAAAAFLERGALLDPYRAGTWLSLENLYLRMNEPELARRKRQEGAVFCPSLRS